MSARGVPTCLADIPPITLEEVQKALRRMPRNKCADRNNIVLEMLRYGGDSLHDVLVKVFNQIMHSGEIPREWAELLFVMLPKAGDTSDPKKWRPVAILDVSYKVFAKIIYHRLQPLLDKEQASDQMGFRSHSGTDDALLVLECMSGKALEWNLDMWVVSIDLSKAFDRVEYTALFHALSEQGLPPSYIELLNLIYRNQQGIVNASHPFPITRGVRQGDVLSPLLFNAALESTIRRWKVRMGQGTHGWQLSEHGTHERLTNVRYADDILLFGKSLAEVSEMMGNIGCRTF